MRKLWIILIIIIVLIVCNYQYFVIKNDVKNDINVVNNEEELIKECIISVSKDRKECFPKNTSYVICKPDEDKIIRLENLTEINLHCGEKIMYSVDMNRAVKLPENFYLCALYDKLLNVTEFRCIEQVPSDLGKTTYVNGGKQVFTCWHFVTSNSTRLVFFYKGVVPSKTGETNLLEFYVFPSTIEEVSQDYFWNNINTAKKMYELHGRITC